MLPPAQKIHPNNKSCYETFYICNVSNEFGLRLFLLGTYQSFQMNIVKLCMYEISICTGTKLSFIHVYPYLDIMDFKLVQEINNP